MNLAIIDAEPADIALDTATTESELEKDRRLGKLFVRRFRSEPTQYCPDNARMIAVERDSRRTASQLRVK
jgi:hypothetical protein